MITDQRIQAYYKKHHQGWRNHYYGTVAHTWGDPWNGNPPNIFMHMARKFKMPVREIKRALGKDTK